MTEDKNLFENLRQLRLKIATERGVPPYVIFSDKTLHQLAIVQPITYIAFGSISGVGTHKLESLGITKDDVKGVIGKLIDIAKSLLN